ncbi:MAG: hypothetical protein H6618_06255 [Deltaproteobacteria bacterium]|nr:hypothetical protein [Deltaproteobacteria bacterium]
MKIYKIFLGLGLVFLFYKSQLLANDSLLYLREGIQFRKVTETLNHRYSTQIIDISGNFSEAPAVGRPDLRTIKISDYLQAGQFFLGFGIPNVFTGIVNENGTSVTQIAAKSLWRESMKIITDQRGRVQSGFFVVPTNLPAEVFERVKKRAIEHEGDKDSTCLKQNLLILEEAGFSLDETGPRLSSYMMPHNFLEEVIKRRLVYHPADHDAKPIRIEFDLVRTTPQSIDQFYNSIWWAQIITPIRQSRNYLDSSENKQKRLDEVKKIELENLNKSVELQKLYKISQKDVKHKSDDQKKFPISIASSSYLGSWLRSIWGDHILFRIELEDKSETIKEYLPAVLKAFDQKKLSWASFIKKNLIFSPVPVRFIHRHMAAKFTKIPDQKPTHVIKALRVHPLNDGGNGKYNFVLTSKTLTISRLKVRNKLADWVLAKHLAISNYSDDVRFAGELWKDVDGVIHINNDSGSYRPKAEDLVQMRALMKKIFPTVLIEVEKNEG